MKPYRVSILQGSVPPYRHEFFNRLGQSPRIDLTVVTPIDRAEQLINRHDYRREAIPSWTIGGIHLTALRSSTLSNADVAVVPFDLHWMRVWRNVYTKPTQTLLWGHGFGKNDLVAPLRRQWAARVAATLLYEEPERCRLLYAGIPSRKLFVAHNTLHVPDHGISQVTRDSFVFVGRLTPRKRVPELVTAFEIVAKQYSRLRLHIVGDGPDRENLQRRIANSPARSNIHLEHATYDHEVIKQAYSRALAYVSAGPVGLAVIHSFAYGVPIIARLGRQHNGPEYAALESDLNCILYEGTTVTEIATAMLYLAARPDVSLQLGQRGYNHYRSTRLIEHLVSRAERAILAVGERSLEIPSATVD